MTSLDSAMDRTRTIFGVSEVDAVFGGRYWGVEKRLDSAIGIICGEGADVIVSRALITILSNSSASIPVSILLDKFPRVNTRVATSWGGAEAKGDVGTERGVAVDGSADWLRVWGKRNENSRANDF